MERKICFLFGAGAEVDYGVSTGGDFSKAVLGIKSDCVNDAMTEYYAIKDQWGEWYPKHTITSFGEKQLIEAALRRKYLDEPFDTKKDYEETVKEEVDKILIGSDEEKKLLDEHSSYMGIIDDNFHTLIYPAVLGAPRFWRVIHCYTRAYLYIVCNLLKIENPQTGKLTEILRNPVSTYKDVETKCEEQTVETGKEPRYYESLKRYANNKGMKASVITTNYTPLCEKQSGLSDTQIAYVHGKIGWFESPYTRMVYEVDHLPENELTFPYLFIQSGVKPIVEERQLREYAKMISFMDDSTELCILGYCLNLDDNHINSLLTSYLCRGKKITYFDFGKTKEAQLGKERIFSRLRIDDKNGSNLTIVPITELDSRHTFRSFLDAVVAE